MNKWEQRPPSALLTSYLGTRQLGGPVTSSVGREAGVGWARMSLVRDVPGHGGASPATHQGHLVTPAVLSVGTGLGPRAGTVACVVLLRLPTAVVKDQLSLFLGRGGRSSAHAAREPQARPVCEPPPAPQPAPAARLPTCPAPACLSAPALLIALCGLPGPGCGPVVSSRQRPW